MENQLEAEIRDFIQLELLFDRKGVRVGFDDRLLESKIIDSMAVVQLVSHLEENYGVSIDDEELTLDNFQTIRQIAGLVRRKLSPRS
ncbi:MAG: acyl carrier protein [Deltaproteobacteria bacterium]|nr:acyl carrier protein [Deltaproteobacteria bacterium]